MEDVGGGCEWRTWVEDDGRVVDRYRRNMLCRSVSWCVGANRVATVFPLILIISFIEEANKFESQLGS